MKATFLKKTTIFFALGLTALLGLIISSIIMINQNGMNERLQGWVNLLWLPLPILTIIIDRIFVNKIEAKKVNKIELYILVTLVIFFIINWTRLQLQT